MKQSFSSKIIARILKLINFKKRVTQQARKALPRSKKDFLPKKIARTYLVSNQTVHNKAIATFEKKEKGTAKHIIFFHGGAYLFEASSMHWRLAEKIVEKSACRMTLVDYPLAPEYQFTDTFTMVGKAYDLLTEQYPEDDFILLGDSAGAGLALALAQKLEKEKHPKPPVSNILLSPWLDMTMSNPEIHSFEHRDHILSLHLLKYGADKYAGTADQNQYLLSPVHGDFQNLGKTLVFFGSEEMFHPDCLKLKSIVSEVNKGFVFREYQGMQHDWAIFPIPERDRVVDEICNFIR